MCASSGNNAGERRQPLFGWHCTRWHPFRGCEGAHEAGVDKVEVRKQLARGAFVSLPLANAAAVIAIVELCAGLKDIELAACQNVTDTAVIAIADSYPGVVKSKLGLVDEHH